MTKIMPKVRDGEFIVLVGRWDAKAVKAIKVTPALVFYEDKFFTHPRRVRVDEIAYSGDEATAKLLAEQINSSHAQLRKEEGDARARMMERDKKFIAAANTSYSTP